MKPSRCLGGLRWSLLLAALLLPACTPPKETSQALTPQVVAVRNTPYDGPRYRVVVGKVENKSPYMNGLFADNTDRLGIQAQTILRTHTAMSNRFTVVDRVNLGELAKEAGYSGAAQAITGAQVVLTGAVTEFGRRETGTVGLGGLAQRSRTQTAYAKVQISVVDVKTTQVLYSVQGAGEFALSQEHVLGFGSEAGYDATLTDKVLNLAMIEAVNRLVEGLEKKEWKPTE